jgi:hypothetical protein
MIWCPDKRAVNRGAYLRRPQPDPASQAAGDTRGHRRRHRRAGRQLHDALHHGGGHRGASQRPPPGWIAPTSPGDTPAGAAATGPGRARCMRCRRCRRCSADTSPPIPDAWLHPPQGTRHSEARPVPTLQNSRFCSRRPGCEKIVGRGVPGRYECPAPVLAGELALRASSAHGSGERCRIRPQPQQTRF